MPTFSSQGLEINYFDNQSESELALIFVHGNSHSLKTFRHQLSDDALSAYRLIAFDLPGHGLSSAAANYDINLFVKVLKDLVSKLNISKYILVGHSLGGHIAVQSLSQLTPSGLFIFGAPPLKKPLDMEAFRPHKDLGLLFKNDLTPEEEKNLLSSFYTNRTVKTSDISEFQKTDRVFRESMAKSFGEGIYQDECLLLRNYKGQKTYLIGTQDELVNGEFIKKHVDTVQEIPSPHNMHIENAAAFNQILRNFCQQLSPVNTQNSELKRISRVWKAGRLLLGLSQKELSKALGISQSSISKYESMHLEPSASDWYNFCQFAGFDAHATLDLGYIDGKKKYKNRLHAESSFTLPMRYRVDFLLKIRELIPYKDCIVSELGEEAWLSFLKDAKVVPEMFYVYDFQLSLNFLNDLIKWCNKRSFDLVKSSKKYSAILENHGMLQTDYSKKQKKLSLIKSLFENQPYYHRVFTGKLVSEDDSSTFSVSPSGEALEHFSFDEFRNFLNHKLDSFQEILKNSTGHQYQFETKIEKDQISIKVAV
jgi:pimeloyl-ACP methyl ester carboxylesterase/transcriptional regulator with XRE-family HTH domain